MALTEKEQKWLGQMRGAPILSESRLAQILEPRGVPLPYSIPIDEHLDFFLEKYHEGFLAWSDLTAILEATEE